jgi:Na+-transporting methylmalonyl-CoA/oxaloacetate decarboxylase gamma subunit
MAVTTSYKKMSGEYKDRRGGLMMRRSGISMVLAFVIIVIGITGCATMGDVVRSKDEGTSASYQIGMDQAWEIARTVFRWEGADAIEEHKSEGFMLTSSGMNFVSMGAVMGAWVEPVDKDNTRVTVVTKRRIATNIATTLTEATFHKRFTQAVEIVKKGGRLSSPMPPSDEK